MSNPLAASLPDRLPTSMRAAVVDAVGPAEAIHIAELPVPTLGPAEVLIKVGAVAVNHVDTFIRSGLVAAELPWPFVIGRDAVGVVVRTGPGVAWPAVGERIWCSSLGYDGRQGPTAEYAVVPVDRAYPAPEQVPDDELVAAAHPASTAYLAVHVHARLLPRETMIIGGAAGQVGGMLVRLAARTGARVIGVCSGRDRDYVQGLGAEAAVDYADPQLADRLRDHAPDGVDVAVDTSGRQDPELLAGLLRRRGRLIVLAGAGTGLAVRLGELYTHDRSVIGFAITNAPATELAAAARALNALHSERALRCRSIIRLPLSAAAEAHAAEERNERSRLVIMPGE